MERDAAFKALEKSQKELAAANKILERLSTLDGLTGIPNRRRFDEALNAEWRRSIRHSTSISLIMLDIDFFKLYNDSYGHQGGDDCLKQVAKCLEETAKRDTDIVARYGGEEFAIVLPETGEKAAFDMAEAVRARIDSENIPHKSSKVADHVTISVGVATWLPEKSSKVDMLLAAADEALYKSKETGRNQVTSAGTRS
jgi:diguanylate cyclase (GGDEF)-like protein